MTDEHLFAYENLLEIKFSTTFVLNIVLWCYNNFNPIL